MGAEGFEHSSGNKQVNDDAKQVKTGEEAKAPAKEKLLGELNTHLLGVNQSNDDKHKAKKAVIEAAIEVLNGTKTLDDLEKVIGNNPLFNKSFFDSKTEKLVLRVEQLVDPRKALVYELKKHLSQVTGSTDKHEAKRDIINAAIAHLEDPLDQKKSEAFKQERLIAREGGGAYDAIRKSKTRELVAVKVPELKQGSEFKKFIAELKKDKSKQKDEIQDNASKPVPGPSP